MATPAFVTLPVAQFPKKKFQEFTMDGKMALSSPTPKSKSVQVQGHNCGSTEVHSRLCKINAKAHENKKETKATKFKKKTGKQIILPSTMGKMTAWRVLNWPRLCTSRNSGIL
jgi:hypothetical protein